MAKPIEQMSEAELANMSDEEYMSLGDPEAIIPATEEETIPEDSGNVEEAAAQEAEENAEEKADTKADKADANEEAEEEASGEDVDTSGALAAGDDDTYDDAPAANAKKPEGKEEAKADGEEQGEEAATEPDYKALYEQVMGSFRANGKDIAPQNAEEARQLMQMGANYTKKMQQLAPHLKTIRMLEHNDLLDPGKLNFLIDISKKDPSAIQQLIKDSGLDPLDIDTTSEQGYVPRDHRVSDEEMNFSNALEEVSSSPVGKQIISIINSTWDDQSKSALWSDPDIMRVMTAQKENGIYDVISAEVERRRMLGSLQGATFLQAYQKVGEELQSQGKLMPKAGNNGNASPAAAEKSQSRVVETRPARRKTTSNNDRVRAAAPSKQSPTKKVAEDFNPLALSDEEFAKTAQFGSRF